MSSFDLINLMTLIQNLPLNFDVAFYNWLKILPPTVSYLILCAPLILECLALFTDLDGDRKYSCCCWNELD